MNYQEDPILLSLCRKTLNKPLSPSEKAEFNDWVNRNKEQLLSFDVTIESLAKLRAYEQETEEALKRFKIKYRDQLKPEPVSVPAPAPRRIHKIPFKRAMVAAATVILFLGGGYFYYQYSIRMKALAASIQPGSLKASLILSNGNTIMLDSTWVGVLTYQGASTIINHSKGDLEYKSWSTIAADVEITPVWPVWNTLVTKGGHYRLTLPDGTKVFLNAASNLHYPAAFNGPERVVELTGEGYFEVAKNKEKPFIVKLKHGADVQVLGTHFNINAYEDEPGYITTLVEGAVKIATPKTSVDLAPGQKATIDKDGNMTQPENANINQSIAWTNNLFNFENQDFEVVMRQLARWYDVELSYKENFRGKRITLRNIPRTESFEFILNSLQPILSFRYSIDGKKVLLWN